MNVEQIWFEIDKRKPVESPKPERTAIAPAREKLEAVTAEAELQKSVQPTVERRVAGCGKLARF